MVFLFPRRPGLVGGSPHVDAAAASSLPLAVPAWSSEPTDLSDPGAPGQHCRDSGTLTGDCSSLGQAALAGQVSRPPNPKSSLSVSEQSTGTNAGARESVIRIDFISSFILNSILLLIWPKTNSTGFFVVLLTHAEPRLLKPLSPFYRHSGEPISCAL